MKSAGTYRIYSLVVPLVCLAVGGVVLASQMTRLKGVETESTQADKNIAFVQSMIKILKETPDANKEPAIMQTPDEQATFLNELRLLASNARVELTRWSNTVASMGSSVNPGEKANAASNSAGVVPIASSLEVAGPYQDLRTFMYSVMRSPRLLNISNVQWLRGETWPKTRLAFTLTRYVMPPSTNTAAAAGTQPGSTNTNQSGGNQ